MKGRLVVQSFLQVCLFVRFLFFPEDSATGRLPAWAFCFATNRWCGVVKLLFWLLVALGGSVVLPSCLALLAKAAF